MNTINDWELASVNQYRLKQHDYEVAVLPVGATEPHNLHLPEGMDFIHTGFIAREVCKAAWEECKSVILLPAIPYGVDCNLMEFPLAMNVTQATLDAMVRDIIVSLVKHGIGKVVILNGHGGNDFGAFVRQVQCELDVHVFLCNWWQVGADKYDEIFEMPDDHAGELETSVALHICPKLVELQQAGAGKAAKFRFEALEKGWVRTSRNFACVNDHCAVGEPFKASAEKGRRYVELVCGRISRFLVELVRAKIDDTFPL